MHCDAEYKKIPSLKMKGFVYKLYSGGILFSKVCVFRIIIYQFVFSL